jgi:hypothetical protein
MNNNNPNGTLILVLGILSIFCLQILGPVAWLMGNGALQAIDSGYGDATQRANVAGGRICGIIGTVLLIIAVIGWVFWVTVVVHTVRHAASLANSNFTATSSALNSTDPRSAATQAILSKNLPELQAALARDPSLATSKNNVGETLLFDASFFDDTDAVKLLIDKGVDVNAKDDFGNTALDKAKDGHHDDIIQILQGHGAVSGKP